MPEPEVPDLSSAEIVPLRVASTSDTITVIVQTGNFEELVDVMPGPRISRLSNGKLHLHHGPIDVIFCAEGATDAVALAERTASERFSTILDELVAELFTLRQPLDTRRFPTGVRGNIARQMVVVAQRHAHRFVTPMAAVAGAVADDILRVTPKGGLRRVLVNNGGDAAFWLMPGNHLKIAIADGTVGSDRATVWSGDPVRGVATSGWRGRSHSLGIADAVTVLACDAATADVAATLIANAVDLPGSPKVTRVSARTVDPESDLGDRPVTRAVAPLSDAEAATALATGTVVAEDMRQRGLLHSAILYLADRHAVVGPLIAREDGHGRLHASQDATRAGGNLS